MSSYKTSLVSSLYSLTVKILFVSKWSSLDYNFQRKYLNCLTFFVNLRELDFVEKAKTNISQEFNLKTCLYQF